MRVVRNRVAARSLVEMINATIGIGVIIVGTLLVAWSWWGLSAGDLAAFAAVMGTTYKPVKDLARGFVRVADAQPAAERFFELIDEPAAIRDSPNAVRIDGVSRGIRLVNVSFSYGHDSVLRDVSLEVAAGKVTAVVGPTGAGKSTLADLLLRFYDPSSGHIEIDGVDLRDIQRDSLLEHIAIVTQEPFLFDGTVRDNLTYGRPGASEEEILAAARAAHVDEFASQLPRGYDTEVGAGGVKLSGGQRQRITIARALLKNPAILVFDEATSSLDAKSERLVQEATFALFRGRHAVFVIAHRLSTIRRADHIVVLDDGRVVQQGTHAELVDQSGLYRDLVDLQTEGDPV
jgi:subfamily B ATP-binding cassette protein MsbA